MARARAAGAVSDDFTFEDAKAALEHLAVDLTRNGHNAMMLNAWKEAVPKLAQRDWSVHRVLAEEGALVTSNCPISTLAARMPGDATPFVGGIEDASITILLPLGPYVALVGCLDDVGRPPRRLRYRDVAAFNAATAIPERRCIYANSKSFPWFDERDGRVHLAPDLPAAAREISARVRDFGETLLEAKVNEMGAVVRDHLRSQG
jgi:hypothetical protein